MGTCRIYGEEWAFDNLRMRGRVRTTFNTRGALAESANLEVGVSDSPAMRLILRGLRNGGGWSAEDWTLSGSDRGPQISVWRQDSCQPRILSKLIGRPPPMVQDGPDKPLGAAPLKECVPLGKWINLPSCMHAPQRRQGKLFRSTTDAPAACPIADAPCSCAPRRQLPSRTSPR